MCSVTWHVTAVTHAKNIPKPPIAAPKRRDPSTATSWVSIESVISAPSSVYTSAATTRTAVTGALRPTTVARMSSVRPASSSATGVAADEEQSHQRHTDVPEAADLETPF